MSKPQLTINVKTIVDIETCRYCQCTDFKVIKTLNLGYQVMCKKCKANGPVDKESEQGAVDKWNQFSGGVNILKPILTVKELD
jgi:hypothetical protein